MTISRTSMPLEHPYNLGRLGVAGDEIVVTARESELTQLARWAAVRSVESFSADVTLKRLSPSRFAYRAVLHADIVQDCVVTLEPVRSALNRTISRELHYSGEARSPADGEIVVDPGSEDDDVREEIPNLLYDLAGPLLEELVLAIDPYPRAPGVTFAAPPEPSERPESPFSILKSLKK